MFYKPKFCCDCGEKIERIDWGITASRRFCELCETRHRILDLAPRFLIVIGILFGVGGLLAFWHKTENSSGGARHQISDNLSAANKNAAEQTDLAQFSKDRSVRQQSPTQESNSANEIQTKQQIGSLKQNLPAAQNKPAENNPAAASEKIYFCGAETKKGTPCSRRMRGGGRCWQHVGQPAMLPPEKLLIVQ